MRKFIVWVSWVLLFSCAFASAESIERLEQIASRADNLDAFLSNTALQDEYFHALSEYFGAEKTDRKVFDHTLQQLKDLKARVPGLAERLWETEGLGQPMSIKSDVATHGRLLAHDRWGSYVS